MDWLRKALRATEEGGADEARETNTALRREILGPDLDRPVPPEVLADLRRAVRRLGVSARIFDRRPR